MKIEYLILGLVEHKPYTGYGIKKFLDGEGKFLRSSVPLSQIYNTLKRMVSRGWIKYIWRKREGKPDIKEYLLTPQGDAILMNWIRSPLTFSPRISESELFTKVWLSVFVANEVTLGHLRDELAFRQEQMLTISKDNHMVSSFSRVELNLSQARRITELNKEYQENSARNYVLWLENLITLLGGEN